MNKIEEIADKAADKWLENQKFMSNIKMDNGMEGVCRYVYKLGFLNGIFEEMKKRIDDDIKMAKENIDFFNKLEKK